jgi:single-stranded DNA-binding protein
MSAPINVVMIEGKVASIYQTDKVFSFTVCSANEYDGKTYETYAKCACFKAKAEKAKEEIFKGMNVLVQGRLSSTKKDGEKGAFYILEVVCEKYIIIEGVLDRASEQEDRPLGRTTDDKGNSIPF